MNPRWYIFLGGVLVLLLLAGRELVAVFSIPAPICSRLATALIPPPTLPPRPRPPAREDRPAPPRLAPSQSPAAFAPSEADESALLQLIAAAQVRSSPAGRQEQMTAVCLHWANFDPPAAIALLLDSRLDPLAGALLPNLAQQWATHDFAAAHAWARRLPGGELRDQVYSRLVYVQAATDPAAGAHLLSMMRPSGPTRDQAILSLAHAWARHDLAAAREWVQGLPSGVQKLALAELATIPPAMAEPTAPVSAATPHSR